MKTLQALAEFLKLPVVPHFHNIEALHLCVDSRQVKPGSVFCAMKGAATDGHAFIEQALRQGAVAIFVESLPTVKDEGATDLYHKAFDLYGNKMTPTAQVPILVVPDLYHRVGALADYFYDHPSRRLKVIGVTGTNGKTSTTHYLAQYLHLLGIKVAVIGTVGNGIWGHLHESTHTTPEVVALHALLHHFVEEEVQYVAMEVSSHALSQNRVDGVQFYAAIFTNLTQDHLDYHVDMQHYAEAKAKLFARPHLKYAILDGDDAYAQMMLKAAAPKTKCFLYSQVKQGSPFYFAQDVTHTDVGQCFEFYCDAGHQQVKTQLLGEFNIANLLASMTTLMACGFEMETLARLSIFIRPVLGRMETIRFKDLPLVVIDYAHTPDALEKVLQSLQLYHKTLWVVFGCGGNRDRSKRPKMAKIAEFYADHVIVTEDNNRLEHIEDIFAEIRSGFCMPQKAHFLADRTAAITYALKHAKPNDIVLLAGKGHETYLDKAGQKTHYDERAVVAGFLKKPSK